MPSFAPRAGFLAHAPWTFLLCVLVLALNAGLHPQAPVPARELLAALQFDREAVAAGEIWRLVTGSLVHWSFPHLALDLAAFLAVGLLAERRLARTYPWALLAASAAVGGGLFLLAPEVHIYRGLSGVDSGQLAAALLCEALAARGLAGHLLPGAAAAVLAIKLGYECATGAAFFSTERLGDIGRLSPLAHLLGTAGALAASLASVLDRKRGTDCTRRAFPAPP